MKKLLILALSLLLLLTLVACGSTETPSTSDTTPAQNAAENQEEHAA